MSIPPTQKAVQFEKTGGPEVLKINEIAVPEVGPEQALLKVEYASVNFLDTSFRNGIIPVPLPKTVGLEAAGTIVKLGSNLTPAQAGFDVGDKVVSFGGGAFAEYTLVNYKNAGKLPASISTKDAATFYVSGLTALTFATEAYEVKKDDWILVHAAAGGFGGILTQIAASRGAHVIATVSSDEKAKIAKANGAEHVLIYGEGKPAVSEKVLELTGGLGVHAVYNTIGKATWEDDFVSVRRKGSIVVIGAASGPAPDFSPSKLNAKNLKVLNPSFFGYVAAPEEWKRYSDELFALFQKGVIKATRHIEEGYPFTAEGAQQAHIDIGSRKSVGKLVLKVA
jgi:NADPH2:quinone reductase